MENINAVETVRARLIQTRKTFAAHKGYCENCAADGYDTDCKVGDELVQAEMHLNAELQDVS